MAHTIPALSGKPEYRSYYSRIINDPTFHELSPLAFKVLFVLRHSLGAAGIGVFYRLVVAEQVGVMPTELEAPFEELERENWIKREQNVVWIVDALANEPSLRPGNPKHTAYIYRLIAPLGNAPIVNQFRERYAAWFGVFNDRDSSGGADTVSDTVSDGVLGRNANHEATERRSDSNRETKRAETGDGVMDFLDQFYPVDNQRREDVVRQLEAVLTPAGAPVRRGVRATAQNRAHLESCCRSVIANPPKDPNVAIVWLFTKLLNPIVKNRGRIASEAMSEAQREEDELTSQWRAERREATRAWRLEHPDEVPELQAAAKRSLDMAADEVGYEVAFGAKLEQQYAERAGFPGFDVWRSRLLHPPLPAVQAVS